MALTRTQTYPAPSSVDSAPFERESPVRVEPATPTFLSPTNGESKASTAVVTDEPATRVGRLTRQFSGLGADLKEVAVLRVALAKAQVTERVDYGVGKARQGSVAGVFILLCICFLLVAAALGLGAWLGHPAWGFLVVGAALFVGAGIAWLTLKPKSPTTPN